jgi:hypothetical protein
VRWKDVSSDISGLYSMRHSISSVLHISVLHIGLAARCRFIALSTKGDIVFP